MLKNRLIYPLFLILVTAWLAWSVLVDFFIVPTVFRTLDSFFKAGDLGIAVFSRLNNLEVITASALIVLTAYQTLKHKKGLEFLILSLLCWIIVMTYFTYLTPKISELTELWKKTDLMGLSGVAGIPDIQQTHQFYHKLYIWIDTVKLLILSVMLCRGVYRQEELQ